jgi:hypothetical protein
LAAGIPGRSRTAVAVFQNNIRETLICQSAADCL